MDTETMEAVRNVIEYLKSDERKNYEETEPGERGAHIYLDVCTLEKYLDGDEYEFQHVEVMCEREGCTEEAVRFYEEGAGTAYVCLEHKDVEEAEERGDAMITNKEGKKVELGVYACSEDCRTCNQ